MFILADFSSGVNRYFAQLPALCFGYVASWAGAPPCGTPFYNELRPLVLPFWTPKKEAKKVPATSDSARLAAHNERRHPAKRARSCASKPHWGFDRYATAQQPGPGGPPPGNPKEEVEAAKS